MFLQATCYILNLNQTLIWCTLCLFAHRCVHHILCCVFVLFFFILFDLCCQFLWIVQHIIETETTSKHTYTWPLTHIDDHSHIYMTAHTYTWPLTHIHDPSNTHIHDRSYIYMTTHTYAWPLTHIHDHSHIYMTAHTYTWPLTHIHDRSHIYMTVHLS